MKKKEKTNLQRKMEAVVGGFLAVDDHDEMSDCILADCFGEWDDCLEDGCDDYDDEESLDDDCFAGPDDDNDRLSMMLDAYSVWNDESLLFLAENLMYSCESAIRGVLVCHTLADADRDDDDAVTALMTTVVSLGESFSDLEQVLDSRGLLGTFWSGHPLPMFYQPRYADYESFDDRIVDLMVAYKQGDMTPENILSFDAVSYTHLRAHET